MNIRTVLTSAIAILLLLPVGTSFAADKDQDRKQDKTQLMDRDQDKVSSQDKMIYGWQLMTVEERKQHRAKMQSFATKEEREAYRKEHHKEMQARAREQGIKLPDMPMRSGGPGPGSQSGGGGGGAGKGR
ncbi:MAG: hypothetical protein PVJ39_20460 [Gammaproteobacteria bacterium]|jgi:hypothetical protein